MKGRWFLVSIGLLVLMLLSSCGGGGGGGSSSSSAGSSLVSITVGGSGKTASIKVEKNTFLAQARVLLGKLLPDSVIAAIPSNVSKITFTISAPDMTTMTKDDLVSGQASITETFTVPNGSKRYFLVEAKDSGAMSSTAGAQHQT